MKDPLYNPTPWIKSRFAKPKTSRYFLSEKMVELKIWQYWSKVKHTII